jgi:MFS family permease
VYQLSRRIDGRLEWLWRTEPILVSYLVDYGLSATGNWRLMFGLACVPAAALFLGMLFQPESPAWLITHGRLDDARRAPRRLRPPGTVDSELASMMNSAQHGRARHGRGRRDAGPGP